MSGTTEQAEASGSSKKKIKKSSSRRDKQISSAKLKLEQLMNGTNLEYLMKVKELEDKYQDRLRINQIWKENRIEMVEKLYKLDEKAAIDDVVQKMGIQLDPTAESLSEEGRREHGVNHLLGEEKKEHAVNHLLGKEEIKDDLQAVVTGAVLPLPIEKDHLKLLGPGGEPRSDLKIENKKLLYNKNWYCRGQSVFVRGENLPEFPAVLFSIGNETITFKNTISGMNVKISLRLLLDSQIQIRRRHPSSGN